jgi:hypothetical protein
MAKIKLTEKKLRKFIAEELDNISRSDNETSSEIDKESQMQKIFADNGFDIDVSHDFNNQYSIPYHVFEDDNDYRYEQKLEKSLKSLLNHRVGN